MTVDPALLHALTLPAYLTDAQGYVTFYNDAAAELWGHRPELGKARWTGALKLFSLGGQPLSPEHSPVAVTLQTHQPVPGAEAVVERPDGSRITVRGNPGLVRDASGQVIGTLNILLDLSDRVQVDIELARLGAIVSSSDDAIVSKDLTGRINSWNAAAVRTFGWSAEEMIGESIMKLIPTELQSEEKEIISRIQRGERVEHFDTERLTKDGRRVAVSITVSPLLNRAGIVVGASKIARDVTERKRTEELQGLLFDELNHRVKNTLATIQAIAGQSLRSSTSPAAFVASFNGRIQSLARAHDVLVTGQMKGADLAEIVREQVALGSPDDTRIAANGPSVFLPPKAAVNLSLVLHELATNARKYGALSVPNGQLNIEWKVFASPKRELLIEWRESGVDSLQEPKKRGFGSTLIERSLEAEGGKGVLRYQPGGAACDLILPLPVDPSRAETVGLAAMGDPDPPPVGGAVADGLRGKRVLVIEDEALVAMDIESVLSDANMIVVGIAGTVDKARRVMVEQQYDAVLLDGNLAGRPVDELAALLASRGVPFAFATGYGREGVPQAFRDRP
ncbi:MAG: PAS domain S-box protein, partial [Rhodospirillales bacterium]